MTWRVFIAGCMASSVSSRFSLPELPPVPHHPPDNFSFPKRPFGSKKVMRFFQAASWFQQWSFLHCDEVKDVAYCHLCVTAFKQKKMREF